MQSDFATPETLGEFVFQLAFCLPIMTLALLMFLGPPWLWYQTNVKGRKLVEHFPVNILLAPIEAVFMVLTFGGIEPMFIGKNMIFEDAKGSDNA